jgi:ribosome biogenesis GTPase / thiamine phosphate phosphatase
VFRLEELGWNNFFQDQVTEEDRTILLPGRVAEERRGAFLLYLEGGEFPGEVCGRLRFAANSRAELPAVGDWVLAEKPQKAARAIIHRVLERKGKFSRRAAGKTTEEQIVAANVDTVFLVSALNKEFNVRRVERYLTLAWESGARPVLVLNKADLCEVEKRGRAEKECAVMGAEVAVTSAVFGVGIERLREIVKSGGTSALLGSSGVGKSALINALLGTERQRIGETRSRDDRGRHTTTSRQLIVIPGGGVIVDTPGMRELQLWNAASGI